jgi:hypothetical protein
MRWIVTLGIVLGLLATPVAASANHRPTTYCSPTGDICQSSTNVHGIRTLRISLAAHYFTRYRLCVTAPNDSVVCKTFRVHKQGSIWSSSIKWAGQFPPTGHGKYDVVWKALPGAYKVGKILGFHVI